MSGTGVVANVVAALLAIGLIGYLLVALLRPEKF